MTRDSAGRAGCCRGTTHIGPCRADVLMSLLVVAACTCCVGREPPNPVAPEKESVVTSMAVAQSDRHGWTSESGEALDLRIWVHSVLCVVGRKKNWDVGNPAVWLQEVLGVDHVEVKVLCFCATGELRVTYVWDGRELTEVAFPDEVGAVRRERRRTAEQK